MVRKNLPERMKCKTMVDNFQGFHNSHGGLLKEDYMRVARDLERISEMPPSNSENGKIKFGMMNISEGIFKAVLPFKEVKVLCNTQTGSGRVTGYEIRDGFATIYAHENEKNLEEEVNRWYNDATNNSRIFIVNKKRLTLEQLDEMN